MPILWFIPVTLLALGATALLARRRRNRDITLSNEPVSADWLAQARSRDDSHW
jgi:cytochrome c-type biogenesis protein CcmH/NrfF